MDRPSLTIVRTGPRCGHLTKIRATSPHLSSSRPFDPTLSVLGLLRLGLLRLGLLRLGLLRLGLLEGI
jgi:hypothetical protein